MQDSVGLSTRTDVRIREATEADDARVLEIGNVLFPDFRETLEEFRHGRERRRARGLTDLASVAEEPAGQVVGYWHAHHMMGQYEPGRYRVGVYVDPVWQRHGVGAALFDAMITALLARDATVAESFARETASEVIRFLDRRGFREAMRTWELRLDLRGFDATFFAAGAARSRDAGVEIVTLAAERERFPDAVRRAHELHEAVVTDIPSSIPHTPVPFDEYVHSQFDSPRALPEAYFLARVGDTYVGEANLRRPTEGPHLMHDVTGVLPAWRGRGIAMALKLATVIYGQAHGFSEIRTWNDVRNAGMLAINDRLGFVREPAWITVERNLTAMQPEDHA